MSSGKSKLNGASGRGHEPVHSEREDFQGAEAVCEYDEEVDVNTALPPLQKHQGSSHVYGGSGSLVVQGEDCKDCKDCKDEWVDATSLSSFSQNVPVDTSRPVKDHVVCCTGNLAVQVGG